MQLPPEIWTDILRRLPPRDLYLGVAQTSRRLRHWAQDAALPRPLLQTSTRAVQAAHSWGDTAARTRLHQSLRRRPLQLDGHVGIVCGVALSADGRAAYTADTGGTARRFNLLPHPAEAPAGRLSPGYDRLAQAACLEQLAQLHVLPDETHMLLASIRGVFVLNLTESSGPQPLGASWTQAAFCVGVSQNGAYVVTGALHGRLQLWRFGQWHAPERTLHAPESHAAPAGMAYFRQCLLSPDVSFVVGLHARGQCFIWRLEGPNPAPFHVGDIPCDLLCLSPCAEILATSGIDGCIYLRTTVAEAPFVPVIRHLRVDVRSASALAFSPDGQYLAVGLACGEIYIWAWQLAGVDLGPCIGHHAGPVSSLGWASDQTSLISGAAGPASVCVWPVTDLP